MKKSALYILLAVFCFQSSAGQSFEEVAAIFQKKCTVCHRPNEAVPFSFLSLKDLNEHAELIKEVLNSGFMPPWHSNPEFRRFKNEILITTKEKDAIINWLNKGAKAPNQKIEAINYLLNDSAPDLVFNMNHPYHREPSPQDGYVWFQIPYKFTDTVSIKRVKLRSSNIDELHHCELFLNPRSDMPLSPNAYNEKNKFIITDTSFVEKNNASLFDHKTFVAGRFPGLRFQRYPEGIANRITPDKYLMYFGHYSPSGSQAVDSSWVELYFSETKDDRIFEEYGVHAFQSLVNPPFEIKAEEIKNFHCAKTLDKSISVFSCLPHAHHLCKTMLAFAISPQHDTIPIIEINKWDFNWQWVYEYEKFMVLKAGTIIHFFATYDNTSKNPANPNSPAKDVFLSMKAEDEMMSLFLQCVDYKAGDEKRELNW